MRSLASEFLAEPVVIYVGDTSGALRANKDVEQHVFMVGGPHEKDRHLADVVRREVQAAQGQTCRVIVFANSKRLCDQLERSMHMIGVVVLGARRGRAPLGTSRRPRLG